ncbi:MAG: hypothetical protein R6U96_09225, partial [Promethearchaeia archaeon]
MENQLMNVKKIGLIAIFLVGFTLSALLFSVTFMSESNSGSLDNTDAITPNENSEELRNSLSVGNTSFGDVGNEQEAQLTHLRNETFINNHTDDGDLSFSNLESGWNMSQFSLNFTELYSEEEYVDFQTRVDGGDSFDHEDIFYATSFQIPNTCILRNISMFLQYAGSQQHNQSFSISLYNASVNNENLVPESSLNHFSDDNMIDMSNQNVSQPAKWHQANFSNRVLNISKTNNRTFFAVFEPLKYKVQPLEDSYIYYADTRPDDPYDTPIYKKQGTESANWSRMAGKSGCLKVNLAPISSNPNPEQVNLTVFDQKVPESGFFEYDQLISPTNDRYNIPVSSLWFSDITY